MFRYLSIYKIAFVNLLAAGMLFIWRTDASHVFLKISICLINAAFLAASFHNISRFVKRNDARLFIGRKRTLIVTMSFGFLAIMIFSAWNNSGSRLMFMCVAAWSLLVIVIHIFEDSISAFLHKLFKPGRRIAVVGYNDSSLKLAEKFKRRGKDFFYGHFDFEKEPETVTAAPGALKSYVQFAKQNNITDFYFSLPMFDNEEVAILVEEAEKHCIRVNFIAPETSPDAGMYRVHYIGGLPVLKRYNEPLRRLHNQLIKRTFDVVLSGFVIVFILSWLVPLVSLLVKMESKGAVFFKQHRSGRGNNSFVCLKFRSMQENSVSDIQQATKDDSRITKVGAFLRKTSLDEFPQFINVFRGDMSIVGPRPHMLRHTEEYNERVNHYMVRLYLKPGLTGWAQVNGYRGEIKNIELMKKRVEHDIWYMENWSLFLDIKIMYLTLVNILRGEENAY